MSTAAATTERRRQLVAAASAYFSGLVQKDVSGSPGIPTSSSAGP